MQAHSGSVWTSSCPCCKGVSAAGSQWRSVPMLLPAVERGVSAAGSQQHPMWGMGSSGSQNAPLVPMAAPQASQRMQGMHQASAGLQSAAWPPELLGHLSQVSQ